MTPVRVPLEGPFSRSVREALESVASPEVVERIVAMALVAARRTTIPEDAPPFSRFVDGPLRDVVVQTLGVPEYEVIAERLGHVLQMATSQVRPREAPRPIAPPVLDDDSWDEDSRVRFSDKRPGSSRLVLELDDPGYVLERPRATTTPSTVLLLTLDPLLVADTESRLSARVLRIHVTGDLLAALASAPRPIALVVDAALPSIDVPTVAALSSAFPEGTVVVLWGMSERQKERLATMFPIAHGWIAGGTAASPADLLTPAR
ncbi:MAG: hypothetical protein M3Y87_35490 [Myxococcota bacterium]|nr:hypothetical protein [Myxococcota bacterium]